jgi:ferritin
MDYGRERINMVKEKIGKNISEKMEKALNDQMNQEFYSAYLYMAMSSYFASENWKGLAHWMKKQSEEEWMHGMKFYNHILERGGHPILDGLEKPKSTWSSPMEAFKDAYTHEQKVTGLINNIMDLSYQEKDHAAGIMLQWFVTEQIEEEQSVFDVIDSMGKIGESKSALFMLDHHLGKR